VHETGDSVNWDLVNEKLELDDVTGSPGRLFIVQTSVAFGVAFEFAEEVINQVSQWQLILENDLA
jgi:hypothetical protein